MTYIASGGALNSTHSAGGTVGETPWRRNLRLVYTVIVPGCNIFFFA